MAKLPNNRNTPFDPARAMRERNQQREAERAAAQPPARRTPHRHGLRPLPVPRDEE